MRGHVNSQVNAQLPPDPEELDPALRNPDTGEAAEATDASVDAETGNKESRVEANILLAKGIREQAVKQQLIDANGADEYILPEANGEANPKAREIIKELDEVTQQLKSPDENEEAEKIKRQRQAELTMELAYNTVGLLYHCYQTKIDDKIIRIKSILSTDAPLTSDMAGKALTPTQEAIKSVDGIRLLLSDIKIFRKNVSLVMPEILEDQPRLSKRANNLSCAVRSAGHLSVHGAPDVQDRQDRDLSNVLDSLIATLGSAGLDDLKARLVTFAENLTQQTAVAAQPAPAESINAEATPTLDQPVAKAPSQDLSEQQPPSKPVGLEVSGDSYLDQLLPETEKQPNLPESSAPVTNTQPLNE